MGLDYEPFEGWGHSPLSVYPVVQELNKFFFQKHAIMGPLNAYGVYSQHNSPMCYTVCYIVFKRYVCWSHFSIKIDELLEKKGHSMKCLASISAPSRALSTGLALNKWF